MFVFHPKFLELGISSDCLIVTVGGVCTATLPENRPKFHRAAFLWLLPMLNCFICCFISMYKQAIVYSICSISPWLKGVLGAHELGTRPCSIVLPWLSSEFHKCSINSAVTQVSGYCVCLGTARMRHFLSKLSCLFL